MPCPGPCLPDPFASQSACARRGCAPPGRHQGPGIARAPAASAKRLRARPPPLPPPLRGHCASHRPPPGRLHRRRGQLRARHQQRSAAAPGPRHRATGPPGASPAATRAARSRGAGAPDPGKNPAATSPRKRTSRWTTTPSTRPRLAVAQPNGLTREPRCIAPEQPKASNRGRFREDLRNQLTAAARARARGGSARARRRASVDIYLRQRSLGRAMSARARD